MSLRTLVNLAYAALAENRDADELAKLDGILAHADRAAASARRGVQRPMAAVVPLTPAQRLLRAVPNQAQAAARMMAQVQATTRPVNG